VIMPNFLIIGAAKSGTTALYYYLKQHPQIYMSPVKEPRFFAYEGEQWAFCGPGDQRIIDSSITDIHSYQLLFRDVSNETAIGEASPVYLCSPKAAERIQCYIPDVKLIAILRNPVDRAYSHFMHHIRDNYEPLDDFGKALEEEERRIRGNWEFTWHYKQCGFYYTQLKRYFDIFPRSQIRVYLYEDFDGNPTGVLHDIFRFLGVQATFIPNMSVRYNVSGLPRNKTLHTLLSRMRTVSQSTLSEPLHTALDMRGRWMKLLSRLFVLNTLRHNAIGIRNWNLVKPQLSPAIRRQLMAAYHDDILQLQSLLQRDLSVWLDGSPPFYTALEQASQSRRDRDVTLPQM
jgi:hypothetical protein